MQADAVVIDRPERLAVQALPLAVPSADDVVVAIDWSGISTGTERLIWSGAMPDFPGMGYPLVPGYESVGRIVDAGSKVSARIGETVFVPGGRSFPGTRCLFGGAASRVVTASDRAVSVEPELGPDAVLLALAATAHHAVRDAAPELVVGHGVLGRLIARCTIALGHPAPTVWERDPSRRGGASDYKVLDADRDDRRDYRVIVDASGAAGVLDALVGRLARGGEVVLAGFYPGELRFAFPPAFMREARIRIAAEWTSADLAAATALVADGRLRLGGLVTHRAVCTDAADAYQTAFTDPGCLKMILDWAAAA